MDKSCCGKVLSTPFCPYCGREKKGDGPSLLRHINNRISKSKMVIERYKKYSRPTTESMKKNLNKWLAWEKFVKEAIKKAEKDEKSNSNNNSAQASESFETSED